MQQPRGAQPDSAEQGSAKKAWKKKIKIGGRSKNKRDSVAGPMGVPVHMGGGRLKRSVQKKLQKLAFIPTNLNMQLMHTESVRNRLQSKLYGDSGEELKSGAGMAALRSPETGKGGVEVDEGEGEEPELSSPVGAASQKSDEKQQQQQLDTFATATFGVPSAHSLGNKEGGLRRLLLSQSTDGVFSHDEVARLERDAQKMKIQQTKDDPLRISAVENDLSTSRAAQVCALHARGLEMTVADLRSHASGRRRNSILR